MKLPEKQQLVILIAIVVVVTGFTFFHYLPMKSKASVLKQKREVLFSSNRAVSMRTQQLPALRTELEKMHKSVENYDLEVPYGRSHGLFLQQIADIMNRFGLTEQRIKPGLENEAEQLTSIPIDIQCRGRLNKIFAFFIAIEKFDRLIQLEQVNLSNTNDYNGLILVRAKLNIYYRQEE